VTPKILERDGSGPLFIWSARRGLSGADDPVWQHWLDLSRTVKILQTPLDDVPSADPDGRERI
jgi:hypothetical protein